MHVVMSRRRPGAPRTEATQPEIEGRNRGARRRRRRGPVGRCAGTREPHRRAVRCRPRTLQQRPASSARRRPGALARGGEWLLGVNLWGVIHGVRASRPRQVRRGVPAQCQHGIDRRPPRLSQDGDVHRGEVRRRRLSETLSPFFETPALPSASLSLYPGPTVSHLRENSRELRPDGPDGGALRLVTDVDRIPAAEVASQGSSTRSGAIASGC